MREMTEQQMDVSIVSALEQKPVVAVPSGFAARVAMAAAVSPVQAPLRLRLHRRVSAGRVAALVAMCALVAAMFVLAPRAAGNVVMFVVEMVLLVQLAGIAWGLGVVRGARG